MKLHYVYYFEIRIFIKFGTIKQKQKQKAINFGRDSE